MPKEHIAIFIPGLGNSNRFFEWAVAHIEKPGFRGVVFDAEWKESEPYSEKRLNTLLSQIEQFKQKGHPVSITGSSAGGSLALTAKHEMKDDVTAGVAICGLLRNKPNSPTLIKNFANFPAHRNTVILFERKVEPEMSQQERDTVLTIRPLWDEIVPTSTMTVPNANNKTIIAAGHIVSISAAMTIYSNTLIRFFKEKEADRKR